MAATGEGVDTAPSGIPDLELRRLWVLCGGRCAICNVYLLEDEFTDTPASSGEAAHNVGRSRSEKSPRGYAALDPARRNDAENLVLLCGRHHRAIDKKEGREEWPVERLREIKGRHEDRIRYLTGLEEDAGTVVVRVMGDIRDADLVDLSRPAVRGALASVGRFPRYELGPRSDPDLELDLRRRASQGEATYWASAIDDIDLLCKQAADGFRKGLIRHLSVFAIARIPLLVALGDRLSDKCPAEILQLQRDPAIAWGWDPDATPLRFRLEQLQAGDDPQRVSLMLSVSGSVAREELPAEAADGATIYEIRPVGETPNPNIFLARQTLGNFDGAVRGFLAQCEVAHPAAKTVNVFPAVPQSAAVQLGRLRMAEVHPTWRLYERTVEGAYEFATEVGT